jgi:hypothetical protein
MYVMLVYVSYADILRYAGHMNLYTLVHVERAYFGNCLHVHV